MYLFNKKSSEVEFQKYRTFQKVTLLPNKGMKVNENSPKEVSYYQLMRDAGLFLMPTETYEKLMGIKPTVVEVIPEPIPTPEPIPEPIPTPEPVQEPTPETTMESVQEATLETTPEPAVEDSASMFGKKVKTKAKPV